MSAIQEAENVIWAMPFLVWKAFPRFAVANLALSVRESLSGFWNKPGVWERVRQNCSKRILTCALRIWQTLGAMSAHPEEIDQQIRQNESDEI